MSKVKNQLKPMDTPVYRYWSALCMSFYSRRLYVDVGKRWQGWGVLYLLLAIALFSTPFFLRTTVSLNETFKTQITEPLLKIPVFYIQNGDVIFDKPMPYIIKNNKNQPVVLIDTTGKVTDFTDYPYLSILITKNSIAFKIPNPELFNMGNPAPSNAKPFVQSFDKGTNLVFQGKKIAEQNAIAGLQYASEIVLYPIIVGMFFSIFIVFFPVLALLGQNFSSIFYSFKINFKTSCRLLIVAGTPMMFLLMIFLTLNRVFVGLGFVLFFLLIAYYSFAIYALRAESRRVAIV